MPTTITIDRPTGRDDELRARRDRVRFVSIPEHRFAMVDGTGAPSPDAFEERIPALYAFAYGARFALKDRGVLTKVGPLEGLWWTTDGATDLDAIFAGVPTARPTWRWTLMIAVPDEAQNDELDAHLADARERLQPAIAATLRVGSFAEGDAAQIMHVGPYAQERPTIERLRTLLRMPIAR
jgi:hypothetical protein